MRRGLKEKVSNELVVDRMQSTVLTLSARALRLGASHIMGAGSVNVKYGFLDLGELTVPIKIIAKSSDDPLLFLRLPELVNVPVHITWHLDGFKIEEIMFRQIWYKVQPST